MLNQVVVVGPPGAGKSTYARAVGERLRLPVIHVDRDRAGLYGPDYREDAARDAYQSGGAEGLHAYESPFELGVLRAFVGSGALAVLDTGGGLLWQRRRPLDDELQRCLMAARCVVLCLPGGLHDGIPGGTPGGLVADRAEPVLRARLLDRAATDPAVAEWLERGGVGVLRRILAAARSLDRIADLVVDTGDADCVGPVCVGPADGGCPE